MGNQKREKKGPDAWRNNSAAAKYIGYNIEHSSDPVLIGHRVRPLCYMPPIVVIIIIKIIRPFLFISASWKTFFDISRCCIELFNIHIQTGIRVIICRRLQRLDEDLLRHVPNNKWRNIWEQRIYSMYYYIKRDGPSSSKENRTSIRVYI